MAFVHEDDAVGDRHRFFLVVSYIDGRLADLALEFSELVAHSDPQAGVQIAERLIEQNELGLGDDGAGERHALLLATAQLRSEEHTSELQSLMRISYAVFCLKKQKKHTQKQKSVRTT